jgi:malonyl-CoA O-methyltransferase
MAEGPDKRQVAASFSRAAATYDDAAELQRRIGERLLALLPEPFAPRRWLDLGCGTGHFSRRLGERFPGAEGLAMDIAEGMLRHARPLGGARAFVVGDAERLPLRADSLDLIYTSLAVQWCEDFEAVLAGAFHALRPGGVLAFASLCSGTLAELQQSWRAVDGFVHVNRFRDFASYRQLCAGGNWEHLVLERRAEVLHYAELRQLAHELKAIGANNLNPGRPEGLTGRARLRALRAAYEGYRSPQGLPATYQAVYGVLRKRE